jgi:adenylate kinase
MNILTMGAAGSGKGTMAKRIVETFDIPHISTGNMFREAMAANTELGRLAQHYINHGMLVPDQVTIDMIRERLLRDDCKKGYLLDGFPRTLAQALALEEIVIEIDKPIQIVLNLSVEIDVLSARVTGRRVCENCKTIYHIKFQPPKVEGVCDVCGGHLQHRSDDTLEQLTVRLREHVLLTKPVLDHYAAEGLVQYIDATQEIDEVWQDIKKALENVR